MRTKGAIWKVILLEIVLFSGTVWSCPCPPCPGCQRQTGTYQPNCSCVDTDSKCGDPACWDCNGGDCVCDITVNSVSSVDTVCVGNSVGFSASVSGNCSCVNWSGGGDPSSDSGTCSFTTTWDTAGTYTVTASGDCGGSKSVEVTVIGVASVEASEDAVCYPDPIIFTATPTPSGPLNCLRWSCRHRESIEEEWSNWYSFYGDGDETWELDPGAWLGPGFYEVRAQNGLNDAWCDPVEVKVVRVDIEPQPHLPLMAGQICTNAQEEYRRAPWQATVIPGGTTATISLTGPVTIENATVSDEQIFYVESVDEDQVGSYTVTITHDDCYDCPEESEEYDVFKFWNTDLIAGTTTKVDDEGNGVCDLGDKGVKADNPTPGGQNASAGIHTPYYFMILTEPSGAYSGSVKAIVTIDVSADYNIKIRKLAPPYAPISRSISINFMWLTVSETWSGSGNDLYGAAVATTDSKVTFYGKTDYCSQFTKTHDDVLNPSWGEWGEKIWIGNLEHSLGFNALEKPSFQIGGNNAIGWEIAVSSGVEEHDSVLVPYNRCYQNSIECEIWEYEIPIP